MLFVIILSCRLCESSPSCRFAQFLGFFLSFSSSLCVMADPDITTMCGNLTLANVDDEDISMQVPNVPLDLPVNEEEFYAVGRVVTERAIKFQYFQDTMAGVWRPGMGLTMRQLQTNRFLIRFYHEADFARVMDDGPWSFDHNLLVMHRLLPNEDPDEVDLQSAEFWIQIHCLPPGFRSEAVVAAIGSFLGKFVKADDRNFDGSMHTFYRVRVSIDVAKPLKSKMKLKRDNSAWSVVEFRYERLPTFCFHCGIIGHGEKFCHKVFQRNVQTGEKQYGPWLRAGLRRGAPLLNQRWVAPAATVERQSWVAPAKASFNEGKPTLNGASSSDDDNHAGKGKEVMHGNVDINAANVPSVCVEQKKRRYEAEDMGSGTSVTIMDYENAVSKNGETAGLASQTRQEQ